MEPSFDICADFDTPASAYLKLAPFRPRFLLESVEGGTQIGRYSFIGFGDGLEIRSDGRRMRRNGHTVPAPRTCAELTSQLRQSLAAAPRPGPSVAGMPFQGGLVGATTFELAGPSAGRLAGEVAIPVESAYYAPGSMLIFDHCTRRAALLHDGTAADRARLHRELTRALRQPLRHPDRPTSHENPSASYTEHQFKAAVETAKEHIFAGDVYQLVLSIQFTGGTDAEPFAVYRALRRLNPSPYMYFCEFDDFTVIGASPEALVRLRDGVASLRPIAGTRPRASDPNADLALERELLADPKEAAEHVMLVDLARNDLGRVARPGSVRVNPYRVVERYSHVMHIVSGVEGRLEPEYDAFDLFAAAFPAGTVVGAPKTRALELIDDMEPVPRGIYAGTVGYFGHDGSMDQAIAIRTIVMGQGRYAFQAGAGIVADSQPESEYREVHAKSAALRAALESAGAS